MGSGPGLGFWTLNWSLTGLQTQWGFFPLWLGYCLTVDALVVLRRGTSLLSRGLPGYVAMFLLSAPGWWLFESSVGAGKTGSMRRNISARSSISSSVPSALPRCLRCRCWATAAICWLGATGALPFARRDWQARRRGLSSAAPTEMGVCALLAAFGESGYLRLTSRGFQGVAISREDNGENRGPTMPDKFQAIKHHFENDRFAAANGMRLVELRPGFAKTSLAVEDRHLNNVGTVQGGAIFTLADFAFGAASKTGRQSGGCHQHEPLLPQTRPIRDALRRSHRNLPQPEVVGLHGAGDQ